MTLATLAGLEQKLFRSINALVEPAVRRGFGSPRWFPSGLIVLESTGFKSGQLRRTPLASLRVGPYRIVSTVRGNRSFWVKNLVRDPEISYYVAGKRIEGRAIVLREGKPVVEGASYPTLLGSLVSLLALRARHGVAIAILKPIEV